MKKYLVLFVLCQLHAAEQKPESKVSKFFKNALTCGAGFEAARPDYIERSRQAQRDIGIPEHKLVKTYQLNYNDQQTNGFASAFGIHLNQQILDKKTYGYQRHVLLHEAVHAKYNDLVVDNLKATALGIFVGVVLAGSPGAAYVTIEQNVAEINKKSEHRADQESVLALKCAPCLQERMEYEATPEGVAKGYMSDKEYQPILKRYIRDNKICGYHAQIAKPDEETKE